LEFGNYDFSVEKKVEATGEKPKRQARTSDKLKPPIKSS